MAQASYKAQDFQHAASSAASDMKERAGEHAERLGQSMQGVGQQMQHQAGMMGDNMKQVATNLDSAVRRSVQDQPMTTLAMAAALGFVLGAIWKS